MVTISENIIIGETISHDAKSILRGVRHPFIWKKGLWYGITTSCSGDTIMYVLSSREMRQKFYQNNNLRLLGIAGSIKEAYEIVLKLVQTGYNNDCIYEMKEYLEAHMPYEINNQMLGRLAKCFGFTLKRQMVNGKIISFYAKIQTI